MPQDDYRKLPISHSSFLPKTLKEKNAKQNQLRHRSSPVLMWSRPKVVCDHAAASRELYEYVLNLLPLHEKELFLNVDKEIANQRRLFQERKLSSSLRQSFQGVFSAQEMEKSEVVKKSIDFWHLSNVMHKDLISLDKLRAREQIEKIVSVLPKEHFLESLMIGCVNEKIFLLEKNEHHIPIVGLLAEVQRKHFPIESEFQISKSDSQYSLGSQIWDDNHSQCSDIDKHDDQLEISYRDEVIQDVAVYLARCLQLVEIFNELKSNKGFKVNFAKENEFAFAKALSDIFEQQEVDEQLHLFVESLPGQNANDYEDEPLTPLKKQFLPMEWSEETNSKIFATVRQQLMVLDQANENYHSRLQLALSQFQQHVQKQSDANFASYIESLMGKNSNNVDKQVLRKLPIAQFILFLRFSHYYAYPEVLMQDLQKGEDGFYEQYQFYKLKFQHKEDLLVEKAVNVAEGPGKRMG